MSRVANPAMIATASPEVGQSAVTALVSRCKTALDLRVGIAAFAVVAVAINTVVVINQGRSEVQETIRDTMAQNSALAAEFEQFTSRTLAHVETVAQFIRREYARSGSAIPLAEMRAEGAIDRQLFVAASVIDERGTVVASTDPAPEIAALADVRAEAAAFHAQQDSGGLFIGTPAKSALAGKALVPLSLRQNKADGSFGGFVLLLLEPARFTDFARIALEADGILTLVGLDGIARARRSGPHSTAGEDLRASSLVTELATQSSGESLSVSPVDGVRRFFSFRRMAKYPLVVGAAVSETDALGPVHQRRMWYYVRAAVLTVIIGLLSALVIRALSRRNRAIAQLSASRETLRAREEEFRTVTESMPQLVWITDADGTHNFFNQQWIDYTGLSLEQSVGEGWKAAFDPAEQAQAVLRWREAVAKGEVYETEYRLRRADGVYRWMLARALPLRDASGRITHWFGTSTDVENQVVARAQLREAQQVAHVGSWSRDPHTGVLTWSDELYQIFGVTPAEFIPSYDSIREFIHPDDQPQYRRDHALSIATMESFQRDVRIVRRDGQIRSLRHSVAVEIDASGVGSRVHGTFQDVTEAREAERQLREQANLLNLTDDAVMVRGLDDTIRFWNRGAEEVYGWTSAEVIGKKSSDFAYVDRSKFAAAKRVLAERGEWSGELDHFCKDGNTVTMSSRWRAMPGEGHTAGSVLVINTDLTEQKKHEAHLLRIQRLESIGTLASGVAHDLNNILAPILMAAPLLREEMPPEKRDQLVSLLEQSAERGAAIVRQVLTFARGADGERVLVQPIYALKEIAEIASETFPKSITVQTSYPEDLALVEADPTQLHQVLLNLCVNARDAMPDGGVLSLSGENFAVDEYFAAMTPGVKAGPHLLLKVSDTGTGIPPAVMDKIFDPFFTTKGIGNGTGLGLSTVLGIVKDYGGTIDAESTGRGTTFRILLPASSAPEAAPGSVLQEELPGGHGETILVVDDEEAIRAVAERLLRKYGYEVLLAEDGPAALAVFAEHSAKIDVIVTDLSMPIMSGVALARTLRKMQPDACIIISAGREDDCSLATMAEIGVAATLPKPYTQAALLRLLDQVMSQNRK